MTNQTYEFINPETNTLTTTNPITEESDIRNWYFPDYELENAEGYIVCYPYGHKDAPITATYGNDFIYMTIDRDCYQFEMSFIHLVGDIAEIWYDTEDVTLVREYLKYKGIK